jgi:hypothetical protein
MGTIYYDLRSGKLEKGHVWQWVRPDIAFVHCTYGEFVSWKTEDVCKCPLDKRHVTGLRVTECTIDLLGGARLADFVPVGVCVGHQIVSEAFAKRLPDSKLRGYVFRDIIKIQVNQTDLKKPKLRYLDITGTAGFDRRLKVRDAANLCPHCGRLPVICPGCGDLQRECLHCGRKTLFLPRAPEASAKDGFRLEGYPNDKHVVEAKDWDGSDWFECGGVPFISTKVKEWLEKTHTHPVDIRPALLNVEGVAVKAKS